MGAEYNCYCSDITCSYPVNGTFTPDQAMVYGAVLEAQKQIFDAMRPGVSWADMHRLMWRVVLEALRAYGVLVGPLAEMLRAGIGPIFMPAGLGHLIGLDTHDVGGFLSHTPPRIEGAGISKLRTARVLEAGQVLTVDPLHPYTTRYARGSTIFPVVTPVITVTTFTTVPPGQVLTVEPGCYFIEALLQPALANPATAKYFDTAVLERFRGTGGVRLEDVVAVTESGIDNYTLCPRTITEVESVMKGGAWPPATDEAPWLHRRWFTLDRQSGAMVADRTVKL